MRYQNEKTKQISFPLGGIGTGSIGLAGNGELRDWEIFNRPNKNSRNGYSHFVIKAATKDGSTTRVLHGDTAERLMGEHSGVKYSGFGFGPASNSMAGFPHFRNVTFEGHFPMAEAGEIKYQIVEGCMIDQMLSDYHAALCGLDGIFETEKKQTALDALYRYNFKPSMRNVTNMWRNFALNDEAGTVICTYPEAEKTPAIPIAYCEECMTGFEYALAALMIAEGKRSEGERMVGAVRDRYDGERRNPWNEIECGSNYARSMASFSLLPIYSGFTYDMMRGYIGFSPRTVGDCQFLFSIQNTYGTVSFDGKKITVELLGAPLTLAAFGHPSTAKALKIDGVPIDFQTENGVTVFPSTVIEKTLEITCV